MPAHIVRKSRPVACPRLLTLPTKPGKCPDNYTAMESKKVKGETCCKRKPLFVLKKGTLSKHGYHADLPKAKRQAALKKAVMALTSAQKKGWLTVFRKLNALMVFNKNKRTRAQARLYNTYKTDRDWVKATFAPKNMTKKQAKAQSTKTRVKKAANRKKSVKVKQEKGYKGWW